MDWHGVAYWLILGLVCVKYRFSYVTFNWRSTKHIVRILIDNLPHDRSVSIDYCLSISLVSKTTVDLPFDFSMS